MEGAPGVRVRARPEPGSAAVLSGPRIPALLGSESLWDAGRYRAPPPVVRSIGDRVGALPSLARSCPPRVRPDAEPCPWSAGQQPPPAVLRTQEQPLGTSAFPPGWRHEKHVHTVYPGPQKPRQGQLTVAWTAGVIRESRAWLSFLPTLAVLSWGSSSTPLMLHWAVGEMGVLPAPCGGDGRWKALHLDGHRALLAGCQALGAQAPPPITAPTSLPRSPRAHS